MTDRSCRFTLRARGRLELSPGVERTVEVETAEGLAASERELERFSTALHADERLTEPLAALHPERGTFSAIFEVDAETAEVAAAIAGAVALAAFAKVGVVVREEALARLLTTRWH